MREVLRMGMEVAGIKAVGNLKLAGLGPKFAAKHKMKLFENA